MEIALLEELDMVREAYKTKIKPALTSCNYQEANTEMGIVGAFVNLREDEIKAYHHGRLFLANASTLDDMIRHPDGVSPVNRSISQKGFEMSMAQLRLSIETGNR